MYLHYNLVVVRYSGPLVMMLCPSSVQNGTASFSL